MADNFTVKDGEGNQFTLRARDVSPGGNSSIQRSMVFATPYPLDYGTGGAFQHCALSGVIAPGLPAAATIYSFRWPVSTLALINRVDICAWSNVAFTTGMALFEMFAARNFTAADSGGAQANLSGGGGRLRTAMPPSQAIVNYSTTGGLLPGSRALDPDPVNMIASAVPLTANAPFFSSNVMTIFQRPHSGAYPLLLASNDGFVIQATVPGNGSWQFGVTTEWDEVVAF